MSFIGMSNSEIIDYTKKDASPLGKLLEPKLGNIFENLVHIRNKISINVDKSKYPDSKKEKLSIQPDFIDKKTKKKII